MRALKVVIFIVSLLCTSAFAQQTYARRSGQNALAQWQPLFELDGELYPSLILATNGRALEAPSGKNYFGDPLGFAQVRIRANIPNAQAHVEIQIEGVSQTSTLDVTLPEAGQEYRVAPLIRYDYAHLARIDQSVPATVTYSVRVNGSDLGQQTRSIRIRSVNDVPFTVIRSDGKPEDLSFLFAGYVNESHPYVQAVLQQALQYRAVNEFVGYQHGPEEVRMQVFALWNVLQRAHFHYSDVTTPSADSPSGHVFSQSVRFIDQSIATQQANCVDGSVLFASLLYKIGIDPILVVKPRHMFVGYFLDGAHRQAEFLETTMLGDHEPGPMNIAFSPVLHPARGSESYKQFEKAVQFATADFNREVLPALQQHKPRYSVTDIAKIRKLGINAIPRPER